MAEPPPLIEIKITGAASLVVSMEQIATELEGQASLPDNVLRGKMEAAAIRLRQAVEEWRAEKREARLSEDECLHLSICEGTCEDCGKRNAKD